MTGPKSLVDFGRKGRFEESESFFDEFLVVLEDAAVSAVGIQSELGIRQPSGQVDVRFSPLRGERVELPDGTVILNDCYNANPMSMRAALDELASAEAPRRVAVLGDMLELGPAAMGDAFEREVYAVADAGEAAALLPEVLQPGDVVLVKASRGVGLEVVAEALRERVGA